ncbi:MAG: S-methyl-5-thioribose-1-phosphate isomerase [candidate division WS1 bacterium]|nr:S-methyl-5-thioribose-1-phosphate isomerase [candidate division WS1 bacterium]
MTRVPPTVEWSSEDGGVVRMIDQTRLPEQLLMLDCQDVECVAQAIERLSVRGAPAIGCAAALGMALAAHRSDATDTASLRGDLAAARDRLAATRPTAVNLFWALGEMDRVLDQYREAEIAQVREALLARAEEIVQDDLQRCMAIGRNALDLIPQGANILTHCNAGALATAGYGTALGVIRAAHEAGREIHVWVDETRPLLQGARLTAWELCAEGIPATLITDNMAGYVMGQGRVDCVVVGSDRIAANGDVANKIGTYTVAVLAGRHDIPLYVAAPVSTIDYDLASGDLIPIEERDHAEVSMLAHRVETAVCPDVAIYNPAFDVTPSDLVSAIITEKGVAVAPYAESLAAMRD